MSDEFASRMKTVVDPAESHALLAADSNTDLTPRPRALYCQEAGTITVRDINGVDLPYTLSAGQYIPFRGVRVTAISSGTFYGWD